MIRRPPRSTLFPTRRSSDLPAAPALAQGQPLRAPGPLGAAGRDPPGAAGAAPRPEAGRDRARSEEHTSELQSHVNLVCRLLLEKKKKNKNTSVSRDHRINIT